MQSGPPKARPRKAWTIALVGLMLGLWLVVGFIATSPVLHGWLHKDAQAKNHHCVLTQLSQGYMLLGSTSLPPLAPPTPEPLRSQMLELRLPTSSDYSLPLSRAPPVLRCAIRVVG
jgi:hypothetical protein